MAVAKRGRGRPPKAMVVELPEELSEDEPEEKSVEQEAAEEEIADKKNERVREPFAKIYRVDEFNSGDAKYCGRFPVGMVSEDFLAKRLGAGKFRVNFFKPGARGFVYDKGSGTTYVIDESMVPEKAPVHDGPLPSARFGGGGDFVEKMLLMMMDSNAKLMSAIATGMSGGNRGGMDPAMLTILQAMMQRRDPVEVAAELAKAFKPDGSTTESGKMKDMIETMVALKGLLGDGGGAPVDELTVMGKAIDAFRDMATAQKPEVKRLAAANPGTAATATESAAAAEVSTAEEPVMADDPSVLALRPWKQKVIELLPHVSKAAVFMSPRAAADTLWNQAGDELRAQMVEDFRKIPNGEDEIEKYANDLAGELKLRERVPDIELRGWVAETLVELIIIELDFRDDVTDPSDAPKAA